MPKYSDETLQKVLNLGLADNDADAPTVRVYLMKLLAEVWREEEGFDGKRPFGNSSWQVEIYDPLAEAGLLAGNWYDDVEADELILAAIEYMGRS